MNGIDNGGSAFPVNTTDAYMGGMTLRQYYAGQVISDSYDDWQTQPEGIAKRAFDIADAMIKEGG